MKITLKLTDGSKIIAKQAQPSDQFVVAAIKCPLCKAYPLQARGGRNRVETHSTQEEDARCTACGGNIGRIHVKLNTLFGLEEDRRVLNTRYRVY